MVEEGTKARRVRGAQRTVLMGRRLWQQAERDIENAHVLLRPRSWYLAAYMAHQAAEKSLKAAYWHLRGEEPAWTHDLRNSAEWATNWVGEIPAVVDAAIQQLGPMLERSRYPSGKVDEPIPADLVGEEDARLSVRSSEEIMAWVQTLLQVPPNRTRRTKSS